ncbi:hypothetical protein SISNIDRAFT_470911 [Sistotremastrum niveocremeum HHB9708]|uniref:BHLH domain-containing protein n=1 Tax=Sistotremastrum niveocremeum HHB9708 TaxID=1314777 RepID=A0A164N7V7_9AGAM|nr:hypothetical protein SISNIDRAFT_470911 [Sistotremastrum niveocremeum HHB9708]
MAPSLVLSSPSPVSASPTSNPPPTPLSPIDTSYPQPPSTAVSQASTGSSRPNTSAGPEKKKSSRRANTAERRATHNAVERQRRETLNGRFLDLAALLPNLSSVRRPSKSAIVNSSIALIHAQRRARATAARELRTLYSQYAQLKVECDEWRRRSGLRPVEEADRSADFVSLMECREEEEMGEEEKGALRMAIGNAGEDGYEDGEEGEEGSNDGVAEVVASNAHSSGFPGPATNGAAAHQQHLAQAHAAAQQAQAQAQLAHAHFAAAQLRAHAQADAHHGHPSLPQITAPGMLPFDSITGMFSEPHLSQDSIVGMQNDLGLGLGMSFPPLQVPSSNLSPLSGMNGLGPLGPSMDKWAMYQMQVQQQHRDQQHQDWVNQAQAAHHHQQHHLFPPAPSHTPPSTGASPTTTTPIGTPPKMMMVPSSYIDDDSASSHSSDSHHSPNFSDHYAAAAVAASANVGGRNRGSSISLSLPAGNPGSWGASPSPKSEPTGHYIPQSVFV